MKDIFIAGSVTASDLVRQRNCHEYLVNKRLRICQSEEAFFYKHYVDLLINGEAGRLEELFNNFKREWYSMPAAYESARRKEEALAQRLFSYFDRRGLVRVEAGRTVCLDFNGGLDWAGIRFTQIKDEVLLAKDGDGKLRAIKIVRSMPYSMRVRREDNKPVNAPELIAMKAALISEYPDIICELWSVKASQDKADKLASDPGVVECAFNGFETKGALIQKLFDVLAFEGHKDCDACRFRKYCHIDVCEQTAAASSDTEKGAAASMRPALRLTDGQKDVVEHEDGPMVVVAVPGAGKTACLVERCVRLVENGVEPRHILLVSFTKKACQELKDRLCARLGSREIPNVMTLNAFGNDILLRNAALLGKRVKLATETDCKELIESVLSRHPAIPGISYDGLYLKYGLISTLYRWFLEIDKQGEDVFRGNHKGLAADTINAVLSVYSDYKEDYDRHSYISYDDQISLVNELFEKNNKLPQMMSRLYRYIMIDEYQDVNEAQAQMVDAIAKCHNNIIVVGDDDQSIYGWRGGSNKFMLNFAERYPDAVKIVLSDNFRSTKQILSACSGLIKANNGRRFEKTFVAHRDGKNPPCVFKNFNREQLPVIIGQANRAGFKNGDIAIIARKNKTLAEIADVLKSCDIACTSPRDYLVDDPVFTAIKDILTLTYRGKDDLALYRLLVMLGQKKEDLVRSVGYSSLFQQLEDCGLLYELSYTADADAAWQAFDENAEAVSELDRGYVLPCLKAGKIIYRAIKCTESRRVTAIKMIASIVYGTDMSQSPAITDLLDMADERGIVDLRELLDLMERMERFADEQQIEYGVNEDTVNILTAHSSKGKEYPFVLVYGLEDYDGDEESIRLLFVAMSRARNSLFLTEGPLMVSKLFPMLKEGMMIR